MAAPNKNPTLAKQPSNPILISPNKQGPRAAQLTHQPKKNFTAHSCPPLRFEPPKAPAPRPRSPPCDPPPIELPPSPPIFSMEDVQNEMEKQRQRMEKRQSAPLSRSLTNGWSGPRSFSFLNQAPSSFLSNAAPGSFRPAFASVSEEDPFADPTTKGNVNRPGGINLSESPPSQTAEFKGPHSYTDSSTIFSMMLRKNSLAQTGASSPPPIESSLASMSLNNHRSSVAYPDDPDLQFSISLEQHEDSSHGTSDSSNNYTLNFRD